jgi:type IV secretion system protein VirB10
VAQTAPAPPENQAAAVAPYTVEAGTRIALGLISSVSTKNSSVGEKVYLETVFPVVVRNHIVIPPGSHVLGTVTQVKRPGRVKGKGELYVRFDSIILPNGTTRDFRSRLGGIDARGNEHLDADEGVVKGDSNKAGDLKTVATGGLGGASLGGLIARNGMGAGVGGAAGAAAGLAGVLLTRGPDAVLAKGSTVEMILDRPLTFDPAEVTFAANIQGVRRSDGPGPAQANSGSNLSLPVRRMPF